MSKLALLTFASLLLLAIVVPNCGQNNGRGHQEQQAAAAEHETGATSSESFNIMSFVLGLLVLYLATKLLASQNEPNVCVYGKKIRAHLWQLIERMTKAFFKPYG